MTSILGTLAEPYVLPPGELVSKPGVYSIDISRYHSQCAIGPSVSSTTLRSIFLDGAEECFDKWSGNPDAEPHEMKDHFILGGAAHHLLLGQDQFDRFYVETPDKVDGETWNANKTVCKNWISEQRDAKRVVLKKSSSVDHMAQIRGMHAGLLRNPEVRTGILNGWTERSIIWQCPETGLWVKIRPDAVPVDGRDVSDLKTTTSVAALDLSRAIGDLRYDMQGALVGEGLKAVLGVGMETFSLVFVMTKRPHSVQVADLAAEDLAESRDDNLLARRYFARCLERKEWPGPQGNQGAAMTIRKNEFAKRTREYRRDLITQELKV